MMHRRTKLAHQLLLTDQRVGEVASHPIDRLCSGSLSCGCSRPVADSECMRARLRWNVLHPPAHQSPSPRHSSSSSTSPIPLPCSAVGVGARVAAPPPILPEVFSTTIGAGIEAPRLTRVGVAAVYPGTPNPCSRPASPHLPSPHLTAPSPVQDGMMDYFDSNVDINLSD